MKKFYLSLFLLVFGLLSHAQNISVKEFYYVENDLTARTHGTSEEDQNGYLCALIKIETTEKGLWSFDVGMMGVRNIEMQNAQHSAEIWVYVPFGVTWMTIQHEQLGKLSRYQFPCSIDKGCTYIMKLTTGKVKTFMEEEVKEQYLTFQIRPVDAELEVDGEIWPLSSRGTARRRVQEGMYHYTITAFDYEDEESTVSVVDTAVVISVILKPVSKEPVMIQPTIETNQLGLDIEQPEKEETKHLKIEQPTSLKTGSKVFFVMANASYSIAPQTSFGLTVGSVNRFGWYMSFETNFNFENASIFKCDYLGYGLGNLNGDIYDYQFTGSKKTSYYSATAGLILKIRDPLYGYTGVGYGQRSLFWQFQKGSSSSNEYQYAKNTDYSYQGIAIDAGFMLHFRGFGVSLGVQTIGIKYLEAKMGIGYTLNSY